MIRRLKVQEALLAGIVDALVARVRSSNRGQSHINFSHGE